MNTEQQTQQFSPSLKQKYDSLVMEAYVLADQLYLAKRKIRKLKKENSFLLDKLTKGGEKDIDDYLNQGSESDEETRQVTIPMKRKNPPKEDSQPKDDMRDQLCAAVGKDGKPCKSKALNGYRYCWHHAPLDPDSPYTYCQYKKGNKACNIPIAKKRDVLYCNYHMSSVIVPTRVMGDGEVGENSSGSESTVKNP